MRFIRPKLNAPTMSIAEDQDQFQTIVGAFVRHPDFKAFALRLGKGEPQIGVNTIVLCARPSDEERALIASGGDIYVSLLTIQMPAIILTVGPEATAQIYGVDVEQ